MAGKDFGDEIGPNTPLRLERAAELAFPMGGMTAAGLRREAQRGRLVIERIAGKDFVTLAAIEEMRKLCRAQAKASATDAGATTITADRIEAARAALERTAKTLTARRKT